MVDFFCHSDLTIAMSGEGIYGVKCADSLFDPSDAIVAQSCEEIRVIEGLQMGPYKFLFLLFP